jgi:hypothetical protein
VPYGGEELPSGEGSLADLFAAERPEQRLGVRHFATAPQFMGGEPSVINVQMFASGSAGRIRIERPAQRNLAGAAGDDTVLLPRG